MGPEKRITDGRCVAKCSSRINVPEMFLALVHPDRIAALIVQDAVAHNEGLGANWKTRRAFWADRAANEATLRTNLLSLQTTRTRHVGSDPNVERYDPDLWTDEFWSERIPRSDSTEQFGPERLD